MTNWHDEMKARLRASASARRHGILDERTKAARAALGQLQSDHSGHPLGAPEQERARQACRDFDGAWCRWMAVGERLSAARRSAGLTQAELAQELGCAAITISVWERGQKSPTGLYRKAVERFIRAHS